MRINLRIKFLSGDEREITCSAADLVKFEDKFNVSITRIQEDMRITHLLYLAYASESRQRFTDKSFEEWVETVENVEGSAKDPK